MSNSRDSKLFGLISLGFGCLGLVALIIFRLLALKGDANQQGVLALSITSLIAAGVLGILALIKATPFLWQSFCENTGYVWAQWIAPRFKKWRIAYSHPKLFAHVALSVLLCAAAHVALLNRAQSQIRYLPAIVLGNSESEIRVRSLELGNGMDFTVQSRREWEFAVRDVWYARQATMEKMEENSQRLLRRYNWTSQNLDRETQLMQGKMLLLRSSPQMPFDMLKRELQSSPEFKTFSPDLSGLKIRPFQLDTVRDYPAICSRAHKCQADMSNAPCSVPPPPTTCAYFIEGKQLWILNGRGTIMLFDLNRNVSVAWNPRYYHAQPFRRLETLEGCLISLFIAWLSLLTPPFYLRRRTA